MTTTNHKTIKTQSTSHNGRAFTHNVTWNDGEVTSQSVTFLPHDNVGSITIWVRQNITTAEVWHYLTRGDSDQKIFAS